MRLVGGIDPGKTGALVILDGDGRPMCVRVMPENVHDLVAIIEAYRSADWAIEKVSPFQGASLTSTWTFAEGFGVLKGIFGALKVKYTLVPPRVWQAPIHLGADKYAPPKVRSLEVARRLFPTCNFLATDKSKVAHDGIVDAFLIAEFMRRSMR